MAAQFDQSPRQVHAPPQAPFHPGQRARQAGEILVSPQPVFALHPFPHGTEPRRQTGLIPGERLVNLTHKLGQRLPGMLGPGCRKKMVVKHIHQNRRHSSVGRRKTPDTIPHHGMAVGKPVNPVMPPDARLEQGIECRQFRGTKEIRQQIPEPESRRVFGQECVGQPVHAFAVTSGGKTACAARSGSLLARQARTRTMKPT